jgi:hypothetical protein
MTEESAGTTVHPTDFAARLRAVEARLERHAAAGPPGGLTDPDPGGAERWEAGQVWAHLAEFPAYWLAEVRRVLAGVAAGASGPVPFGRTKADAARIAAIERERGTDPSALFRRVRDDLAGIAMELASLPPDAWEAAGLHPTLGEMPVRGIVERFVIGHLEEHADQLDLLRERERA